MAFRVPLSFQSVPKELQMSVDPIYAIPDGKKIYFTELIDDDGCKSTRDFRLSNNVNSAAIMSYVVNEEVFENETLTEIFTKSVLGGYSATTNKKHKPMKHPYLGNKNPNTEGLYAKDFISVTPFEFVDTDTAKTWMNFNLCKVTINFETLEYPVNQLYSQSGYNPNFIRKVATSASNRISTPTGWYRFIAPSDYAGFPATFGSWFTQPNTAIELTIYHVTHAQLFGGGNDFNLIPTFAQFIGNVNVAPFANIPAQKLLLDSSQYQPYYDWLGNRLFNVRLFLLFNEWGWNKSITPGGSIDPIGFIGSNTGPFPTFAMSSVINGLNPL